MPPAVIMQFPVLEPFVVTLRLTVQQAVSVDVESDGPTSPVSKGSSHFRIAERPFVVDLSSCVREYHYRKGPLPRILREGDVAAYRTPLRHADLKVEAIGAGGIFRIADGNWREGNDWLGPAHPAELLTPELPQVTWFFEAGSEFLWSNDRTYHGIPLRRLTNPCHFEHQSNRFVI